MLLDPKQRRMYDEELQAASLPTATGEEDAPDFFQYGPECTSRSPSCAL